VGEIRDYETAETAIRAALTGHLVFSTLHTNDSAGAITRLLNIGIESYLISSSVEGIIAQRLVRTICRHCKSEYQPEEEAIRELDINPGEDIKRTFYKATGCGQCRYTGYIGRTAIYEMLLITDAIRDLIMQKAPANIIKQKARDNGMATLRENGWQKILMGMTTPEEVLRVTQEDEFMELKKIFNVDGKATTANYGDPFVGNDVVANSKAAVVGAYTSGHELIRNTGI